jgi:hypothetical protein
MDRTVLRIRKFAPVDREYSIYEVLENDRPLFDIGRRDDGQYEIAFHEACNGRVLPLDDVMTAIRQATEKLRVEE